jgi:hypothetical protein
VTSVPGTGDSTVNYAWSQDASVFPQTNYPWSDRGGHSGNSYGAGLFNLDDYGGEAYERIGFRIGAATF